MVMFMSINPYENINDFKACGKELVMENFDNYNLVLFGQNTFGFIIVNSRSKGSPFQVRHVLNKPHVHGYTYLFSWHSNRPPIIKNNKERIK
jgi:hypothetical protein